MNKGVNKSGSRIQECRSCQHHELTIALFLEDVSKVVRHSLWYQALFTSAIYGLEYN